MPQLHSYLREQDYISALTAEGYGFYVSDADQNDLVTGQTSFADTTPTFQIAVSAGGAYTVIPLEIGLNQSGSVAGGAIDILVEIDNAVRYASGGTAETAFNMRTDGGGPFGHALPSGVAFRSNPTAASGYGIPLDRVTVGQDVSSAEGAINQYVWTPSRGLKYLVPTPTTGASMNVYTYAGTTGPTWLWQFAFLVVPNGFLPFLQ
jgi:hypothetical protein